MTNHTCRTPGCEKPVTARGLCSRHYNQWHSGKTPTPDLADGACKICGGRIDRSLPHGNERVYCSPECRAKGSAIQARASYQEKRGQYLAEQKAERAALRLSTVKTCPGCSEEFTPQKSMAQVFCSKTCGKKHQAVNNSRKCSVEDCLRPHAAKGMCQMHWRRWARQTGRERPEAWSQERYERWKRRQDRKRTTQVEPIRNIDVFERDHWTCGLCSEAIDRSLSWPDPMCATLDYKVPLSEGGTHTWDNVQAAHARCNIQKGSSVAA